MYPELQDAKKFTKKRRTQRAKSISLAEHGITYSNHMTKVDKKRAAAVLDAFQVMNQLDMRDDAIKRKLNINIYDYNEAFDC